MSLNSNIKSPCIHVCVKNEVDICMGCFRTMEEIRSWYKYTDEEKLEVKDKANHRKLEFHKNLPFN
ncbi:MAG: DUF1289 domain-containing protein [Marinilabiliales bacterium]|nr:MAG: DUF1289 domain-containing protein [Marinilabiliales bacterium]